MSLALTGVARAEDSISAAEIQHFEQTFEDWAGRIIKSVHPKAEFTVVARVELSAHPEKLAAYEEAKAANHLPGLPEVPDSNYNHPLESPLLPLLQKKSLKVYLRTAMNRGQETVLREIIQAKMKLSPIDQLAFESVVTPNANKLPTPSKKLALLAFFAGTLMISLALIGRNRMRLWATNGRRASAGSTTDLTLSTALSPSHQIANTNAATLREALIQERVDVIAKASMNATRRFSHRILGEMDQEKFDLVNQWIERNKGLVANTDSAYARLMLAARIQQLQNQTLMKSIEGFSRMRSLRKELQVPKKPSDLPTPNREVTA